MTEHDPSPDPDPRDIPLGQRFFDSPFLLLVLGLLVMIVFFTAWGIWEVVSLPTATLP